MVIQKYTASFYARKTPKLFTASTYARKITFTRITTNPRIAGMARIITPARIIKMQCHALFIYVASFSNV